MKNKVRNSLNIGVCLLLLLVHLGIVRSYSQERSSVDGYFNIPNNFVITNGANGIVWKYIQLGNTGFPNPSWNQLTFDDSNWNTGYSGFYYVPRAGDILGTPWNVSNFVDSCRLYLRGTFTVEAGKVEHLLFWARWDDVMTIYINGVEAQRTTGWSSGYRYLGMTQAARSAIKPNGPNIIAVYVKDTGGGRYFDLGLVYEPLMNSRIENGYTLNPDLDVLGSTIKNYMVQHGIPSGVFALRKGDDILVSQAFGYKDKAFTEPLDNNAVMRLASVDKIVTTDAIRKLINDGYKDPDGILISGSTKVFPLLVKYGLTPGFGINDERINDITINQLIDFRSGLSNLPDANTIYQNLGIQAGTSDIHDNIKWLYSSTLNYTPGTSSAYVSTGHMLLRYVIHKVTGDLETFLQENVFSQSGNSDIYVAHERLEGRQSNEPWYANLNNTYDRWINLENYTALAASAPALASYQGVYLATEKYFGSMEGTWSVATKNYNMDYSYALIFNISGVYDDLSASIENILGNLPASSWLINEGLSWPWQISNIGTVATSGSAKFTNETIYVLGAGGDIGNTDDECSFVYQPITGNCTLIAKVNSIEHTHDWAKAGVMIRENLDPGAKHACTAITPQNGVVFLERDATNGPSAVTTGVSVYAPYWLKIERIGDLFTSSVSMDGLNWLVIGTKSITMKSDVCIGMAVTSHEYSNLCSSYFSGVSVTSSPVVKKVLGVRLAPTSVNLQLGSSSTLMATVFPTDADNASVHWSSNNTAVATVNNGVVSAVSAGHATISVTTVDGGFIASCSVTVVEPNTYTNRAGYEELYEIPVYTANRRAQLVEMPEPGVIHSISMYHGSGSGSMLLAIYDDISGKPGSLLASTPLTTVNSNPGWQEVDLENPVEVNAGVYFWLAFVYEIPPEIRYTAQGPGRANSDDTWANGMPDEFGLSSITNYRYSIFASYQTCQSNTAPVPPENLHCTYLESNLQITLDWTDLSTNEDGFVIERSNNGGAFIPLVTLDANTASFSDLDVSQNTRYAYRVYAFNQNGNSDYATNHSIYTGVNQLPIQVGYTSIFPLHVQTAYRRAQQVTSTANGSVGSISMYLNPLNEGNFRFAVYEDYLGSPGQLLGCTPITPKNTAPSWHTANLNSLVPVVKDQKIWLAWMFDLGTEVFYTNGTPGRAHSDQFWSGSFPNNFGISSTSDYIYSIYMTLQPNGDEKNANPSMPDTGNESFTIYPNPLTGPIIDFFVEQMTSTDYYTMEIRDIVGRLVQKEIMELQPGKLNQLLLTHDLNESILIFRLYNSEHSYVKKIIVCHD